MKIMSYQHTEFRCLIITLFLFLAGLTLVSCTDDLISPEPEVYEEPEIDPNIPEEIRNGFSISFTMELPQMGYNTRVSNTDLLDIDNYIDLEKVRILFFVCASDNGNESIADTTYTNYYKFSNNTEGKPYMAGTNDHFLFESKSRWVSTMSGADSDKAQWQVTAPVFTYGNNDEYRWEDIRYALTKYPFKVVVLANRPDVVEFGNFDSKFKDASGKDINVTYNTGRGPMWGPEESWIPKERRTRVGDDRVDWSKKPIIHDLHHCQWDVVYASKNTGDKESFASEGVYDFIMKNPDHDHNKIAVPNYEDPTDPLHKVNNMGALSVWTEKRDFAEEKNVNAYILPDKIRQAIPMYGCQVFDPIPDWSQGTPYNISDRHHGQSGQMIRKNIFLLRSLVKLELIIPKWMQDENGDWKKINISKPYLRYSNVMARCEPLDVATPTERLWHDEDWSLSEFCEWKNIYDYGPIINGDLGAGSVDLFQRRMAWFYGAWRDWWHYNDGENTIDSESKVTTTPIGLPGGKSSDYFYLNTTTLPYPRIYNPVIQRNENARIDYCRVDNTDDDDDHTSVYHYVVYTGERNINDPSKFGTNDAFNGTNAQLAYFKFTVDGTDYFIPISEYLPEGLAATRSMNGNESNFNTYRTDMAKSLYQRDWNMPLLRNHTYTFTVRSFGKYNDNGGLDVKVVSTEKRFAPSIFFQ